MKANKKFRIGRQTPKNFKNSYNALLGKRMLIFDLIFYNKLTKMFFLLYIEY